MVYNNNTAFNSNSFKENSMTKIDKRYENEYVQHSLKDVEVRWAKLIEYDDYKGMNKWKLDVILDEQTAQDMLAIGFNVREKDGVKFFTPSKKAFNDKGEPQKPPILVDAYNKPFTEEVGNGSIVNINFSGKKWDVTDKITAYLSGIQVIKHEAAQGGSGFSAVEEEDAPF